MKLKIYFNLHKRLFSVQEKGKVIGHYSQIYIRFPSFTIYESMRLKVIEQKKKNVHAFITAFPEDVFFDPIDLDCNWTEFYYNPYTCSQFVYKNNLQPIQAHEIEWIQLTVLNQKPLAQCAS